MNHNKDNSEPNPLIGETFSILMSCQQKMSYSISQEMKVFGITSQQYEVLKILNANSKELINLNKVKENMRENVPDISRIMQRLVEKGLIIRQKQSSDKRNSTVSINKKGADLLAQIDPVIKKRMESFFEVLSQDELQEFSKIIQKVNQNKA